MPERDWPETVACFSDLGFEQTLTYSRAAAARIGARLTCFAIERDRQPVAAAALRVKTVPGLGRGIAWCPSGPLTRPREGCEAPLREVLEALRLHVTGQGHILRLRLPVLAGLDPEEVSGAARAAGFTGTERAAAFRTVLVPLDDDEALMARLHGKWRNALRTALKSGIELETGGYDALYDRFRVLYDQVSAAKGFAPDIPPEFYRGLSGLDFAHRTLIAHRDGEDLGAITVGLAGSSAVYLFGATSEAGRRLNAGHFLTWQGYRMARAAGVEVYDLGGIDPAGNPTVARFKQRAGGEEAYMPAWEACPAGIWPPVIRGLESLLRRARGKRA